jgi:hypothetical protein
MLRSRRHPALDTGRTRSSPPGERPDDSRIDLSSKDFRGVFAEE